ncbi:MAG: glycosyltransferase [Lentisphaerae bacterium]|nr:glycosyltransferase [Lentisphaerota bacterium]
MKEIVVISLSPLETDPRVNRQIRFLSEKYKVTAIGLSPPQIEGVRFISLPFPSASFVETTLRRLFIVSRRFEAYYWKQPLFPEIARMLSCLQADLILVNDLICLPAALKAAGGAKVFFDAHEYYPGQWEDVFKFRLLYRKYAEYLCRTYMPQADVVTTVCRSIADRYKKDTGVRPDIITNAPDYEELEPLLLKHEDKISMVHHGGASVSRKLENMIRVMDFLDDRFELCFMLVEVNQRPKYIDRLKCMCSQRKNIRFLDPVPMRELPKMLNKFDVGLYLLEPKNFNSRYALPNKLFEFIQARLAVAIGPSPEMARVVREHDCGVVSNDFSPAALAKLLQQLDFEKINYFKQQSHRIARQLSAENNRERLLDLVEKTLEQ